MNDTAKPHTDAAAELAESPFLGTGIRDFADARCRDALARLTPEHFTTTHRQTAFAILRADLGRDAAQPLLDFPAAYAQATGATADDASAFLHALLDRAEPPDAIDHLVGKLEQAHRLRMAERECLRIAGEIRAGEIVEPDTYLASIPERFAGLSKARGGDWPASLDASAWMEEEPAPSDPIVEGCIDAGDKALIVAPSKGRKSFLALHLALAVASARDFIGFTIPRPRRVLLVQFEIKESKYHERLRRAAHGAGVSAVDLGGRLYFLNLRGRMKGHPSETLRRIAQEAKKTAADFIILDPFYKLMDGDENAAHEVKPVLAILDRMAEETGAAVLYVHHTGKGNAGDRQSIDRAVGSGVIARDFDAQFSVTPHRDHADTDPLLVVELTARNYPPRPAFTIAFDGHRFTLSTATPIVRTSQNGTKSGAAGEPLTDSKLLEEARKWEPLPRMEFYTAVRSMGATKAGAEIQTNRLLRVGELSEIRGNGARAPLFIGHPEAFQRHPISRPVSCDGKSGNQAIPDFHPPAIYKPGEVGKAANEPTDGNRKLKRAGRDRCHA